MRSREDVSTPFSKKIEHLSGCRIAMLLLMTVTHYRALFRHNAWANGRILEVCASLPHAVLPEPAGLDIAEGSILSTLNHLIDTEDAWLARCQGHEPDRYLSIAMEAVKDDPSYELVSARSKANAEAWLIFLGSLAGVDLNGIVSNTSASGRTFSSPLWARLSHVLSHSTQHRGELALALTRLDMSPGELDFLYYFLRFDSDR
jgi:uncharacterized damage-inducible protein DinB